MSEWAIRLASEYLIAKFRNPKDELLFYLASKFNSFFDADGLPVGQFWQRADAEYKADPESFKAFSVDTPAVDFRAPNWIRWLACQDFCEIGTGPGNKHVWKVDQKFLNSIHSEYLHPARGMTLRVLCGMFCNPDGKEIDPASVNKHGGRPLDQKTSQGLIRLLWPGSDSQKSRKNTT